MEEKNNKKKIVIGSVIIVLLLLVVVIGSTYAYFSLNVNGDGTNTKVTITTGSSNQIKLSGGLEDFHIKLDVKDMAYNRQGDYYATSNKDLNYEKDKTKALTEIGRVEVIGELEERHTCTAEAKVTLSGSMASLIQKGDLELSLQSEHYANTSDLKEISNSYPATLTFILEDVETSHIINAYLKFTNRNIDQSYLAGQTLNVNIIIEDFKCTTDTIAPELNKFYFNNDTQEQQYTSNLENTLYLSWLDEDVKEYCITQEQDTTNCLWKPTDGKQSISEKITLDGVEGDHIYYGYIKDNAGNISTRGSASIIYDVTNPTIDKFYIKEEGNTKYTNKLTNKVYFTYNDNNIKDMCVSEEQTPNNCKWTTISSNMDYTFTNNTEGLTTIYGYVRDKANNISNVIKTDTIIYDITPPTIESVTVPTPKETSLTLNIVANDNKEGINPTSGIYQYCYSRSDNTNEGNYTCVSNSSITISNLNAGASYDFWIYVKDNARNGSPTNRNKYTFKTKAKPVKNTLSTADKNSTLQSTPWGGLYRYKGNYDKVLYNYICFGTNDKTQCLNTPDTYMYRIIGVTDGSQMNKDIGLVEGQLKLIKATPLSETKQWHTDQDDNWNNSELKSYLNGTKPSDFLPDAKTKQWQNGTYWDGLITSQQWYMELKAEYPWPTSNPLPNTISEGLTEMGKVGLMYASDYYNSGDQNKNNWLNVKNGWSTSSNLSENFIYEWTMSRYGLQSGAYRAWYEDMMYGDMSWNYVDIPLAVRPVFYLTPNITLTGEGTTTSPFIINS